MKKLVEDGGSGGTHYKMKPRRSSLLGCFCFPGKSSEKKLLPEIVESPGSHRKKTRWLQISRWSRFVGKKSSGKTVPVDVNLPRKRNRSREREVHTLKKPSNDDQKLALKIQSPAAAGDKIKEIQVVESDRNFPEKADEWHKKPINIVLDESAVSKKVDTHKHGVFSCRKKVVKAKTVDDPNSPLVKKKSGMIRSKSQPAIFQSITHPPTPKPKKQSVAVAVATATATAATGVAKGGGKGNRENSKPVARKYDPVIGMSILIVILVVMLLWGKLCAILCTSACFFFVSWLGVTMESKNYTTKQGSSFEVNSDHENKRVVMEGFLARNRRKVVGFL